MKKGLIYIIGLAFLFVSCSSSSDDGGGNPPPDPNPQAATLVFPENNQECNQGTSINATQSSVTFRWNASLNTDSYTLVLKDLDAQTTTEHSSIDNEKTLTLKKGNPYSWYIISRAINNTQTGQSQVWKFYNAGDGATSHPPFPAEAVTPGVGANLTGLTSVNLSWNGSDVDNDIASYDVYFGTDATPTNLEGNTTSNSMDVTVAAGNTYYWRVITMDDQGNSSQSEIFQFKVD